MLPDNEHKRLANWATTLDPADLPAEVDQWVRLAFLDFAGLLAAGHHAISGGIGGLVLHEPVESAQLARTSADPLQLARHAYHLARAANVLDGDDGHNLAGAAHVGSTVFGALLAAAHPQTSYTEFLAAAIVGYEIGIRAGADRATAGVGARPSSSGAASSIGATAALARLHQLDEHRFARALDISLARAPISALSDSSMRESIGWAAYTATLTVETATRTSTDPRYADDGVLFTDSLRQDPSASWIGEPGEPFLLTGSYRKPYAACRVTHAAIDGIRQLKHRHDIQPYTITRIAIETTSFGALLNGPAPRTINEGVFHYPTIAALAAITGGPTVEDWINERHRDPLAIELASRVCITASPRADSFQPKSYPARVVITTSEQYATEIVEPTGNPDPQHALSQEQIVEKASVGLSYVLDDTTNRQFVDAVLREREISLEALAPFIVTPTK